MTAVASSRIKICGITRLEDALLAKKLGAWALGLMFYEGSPRKVALKDAAGIISSLGISGGAPKTVGVFVNASQDQILKAVEVAGLSTVQLHGDEPLIFCEGLKKALPSPVTIWKAIRARTRDDLRQIPGFSTLCEAVLLDAFVAGEYGGTGMRADWSLAREAKALAPIILAGGLNPGNIRQALVEADPFAVDVSSGVEDQPGLKSADKMREFFERAKGIA